MGRVFRNRSISFSTKRAVVGIDATSAKPSNALRQLKVGHGMGGNGFRLLQHCSEGSLRPLAATEVSGVHLNEP